MELSDINSVQTLLEREGISLKKSLGQNFLIDGSVCPAMAAASCTADTGVLEIGPGIGVLTAELARVAKRVVAVELDGRLERVLKKTLAEFSNIGLVFGDAMKLDLKALIEEKFSDCSEVVVCANLPYYITSPVVMRLLEERLPLKSITVMVQREAAERLCAEVGTRAAGAVTAAVSYYSCGQILFGVGRNSFLPPPKVDSAVIQLTIREKPPIAVRSEKHFFSFVKACFAQRRKTLVNTVSNTLGIDKDVLRAALKSIGLPETARGEQLTMEQLAMMSDLTGTENG